MESLLLNRIVQQHCLFYLSVLAVVTFTVGCNLLPPQEPQLERLFPLFITLSDLPPGWQRGRAYIEDVEGAVSRTYLFHASDNPDRLSVTVSQQLIIYSDAASASTAYPRLVDEEFPTPVWESPPQLAFRSKADQFDLRCMDVQSSSRYLIHACRALGRYGDVIALIYANVFDDKWLTFADFERLLDRADERLYEGTKLKPTP